MDTKPRPLQCITPEPSDDGPLVIPFSNTPDQDGAERIILPRLPGSLKTWLGGFGMTVWERHRRRCLAAVDHPRTYELGCNGSATVRPGGLRVLASRRHAPVYSVCRKYGGLECRVDNICPIGHRGVIFRDSVSETRGTKIVEFGSLQRRTR